MYSPELPAPILFHSLKHHLGYAARYVQNSDDRTEEVLQADLKTLGSSQADFYIGPLSPGQVATEVITQLRKQDLLHPEAFRHRLVASGKGYSTIVLSDATDWILRWGIIPGRHVHLHPARYAPNTIRVKAYILKTAIAALIAARRSGKAAIDVQIVNQVRTQWLKLPPVKSLDHAKSFWKVLQLFQSYKG